MFIPKYFSYPWYLVFKKYKPQKMKYNHPNSFKYMCVCVYLAKHILNINIYMHKCIKSVYYNYKMCM